MADLLLNDYDLSTGDVTISSEVMLTSAPIVISFQGTGLNADDATLAWELSVDNVNFYPVKDNDGNDVVETLITTAGAVGGYLEHQNFPAPFQQLVIKRNSVTVGTFSAISGGRVGVNR